MAYSRARQIEPPRWLAAIVGFFGTMAVVMVASFFFGKSWSFGGQLGPVNAKGAYCVANSEGL
jgi:hypothetical protein